MKRLMEEIRNTRKFVKSAVNPVQELEDPEWAYHKKTHENKDLPENNPSLWQGPIYTPEVAKPNVKPVSRKRHEPIDPDFANHIEVYKGRDNLPGDDPKSWQGPIYDPHKIEFSPGSSDSEPAVLTEAGRTRLLNGMKPSKDDPVMDPAVSKEFGLPDGMRYKELPGGQIQPYSPYTGRVYPPMDPSMGFSGDPELHSAVANAFGLPEGLRYKELPGGQIQPYSPYTGQVYDQIDPSMGFSYEDQAPIMVPGQTMPYKPTDPENPDLLQEYNNKLYEDYYGLNTNPYSPGIPEEEFDPMIFGDAMPEAPEGPENPPSELEPGPATPNHFAQNTFTGTLGPIEMIDSNSPVLPLNPGSVITPTDEMRMRFGIPEGAFIVRSSDNESYQIVNPMTGERWPLNGTNVTNESDEPMTFNFDDYAEWYKEHPEALSSGEDSVDMRPLTGADIEDAHFLEGEGFPVVDEGGGASRSLVGGSVDSDSAGDSSAYATNGITLPNGSVSMAGTPYYGPGGSSGYINPGTGTLNLGTTLLGGLGGTIPYTGSPFDLTSGAGGVTGGSGAGAPVAPAGLTSDSGGTGVDAGTGDAAGEGTGESAPEVAPVVVETPAGPQLMTNLRLKGGTDIKLRELKYYQGADGRFYSDKEGKKPVEEHDILRALANKGRLPVLNDVKAGDIYTLRPFIGSQAYGALLPRAVRKKGIDDIWWDLDANGMPVLKYMDRTGATGERSYDSLLKLFARNHELAETVNKYGLITHAGLSLWSDLPKGEANGIAIGDPEAPAETVRPEGDHPQGEYNQNFAGFGLYGHFAHLLEIRDDIPVFTSGAVNDTVDYEQYNQFMFHHIWNMVFNNENRRTISQPYIMDKPVGILPWNHMKTYQGLNGGCN